MGYYHPHITLKHNPPYLTTRFFIAQKSRAKKVFHQGRKDLLTPPLAHHLRGHSASLGMGIAVLTLQLTLTSSSQSGVCLRERSHDHLPSYHKGPVYSMAQMKHFSSSNWIWRLKPCSCEKSQLQEPSRSLWGPKKLFTICSTHCLKLTYNASIGPSVDKCHNKTSLTLQM